MKICRFLLVFILIGCAPMKPETRIIRCVEYVSIDSVQYIFDSTGIDSLKKENHLLRVEIDHLKDKLQKLEILYKMKKQADKINLK